MSKLRAAMKEKIKQIVLLENRPFSFRDFREFELGDKRYKMSPGTFRNQISSLKKNSQVELAFRSGVGFYTIPGKKFDKKMTAHHMGVSTVIDDTLLKRTRIYGWLKNCPTEKCALHNIRLTLKAAGIWKIFSNIYSDKVNPTSTFFNYMDVIVTVHYTDTVTVAIACSLRPIAIDVSTF